MQVDLLLPTSLSEIPLSRYQSFVKTKEASNDEEFIANVSKDIAAVALAERERCSDKVRSFTAKNSSGVVAYWLGEAATAIKRGD